MSDSVTFRQKGERRRNGSTTSVMARLVPKSTDTYR